MKLSEGIPSIFDGWKKQIIHRSTDGNGAFCANGWIRQTGDFRFLDPSIARVAGRIRRQYILPNVYAHPNGGDWPLFGDSDTDVAVLAYANNELKLTPDDFRRIDRETQIEAALKSIEQLSPVGRERELEIAR